MIKIKKLFLLVCGILSCDMASADGRSWHFDLGIATPHFSAGTQNVFLNPALENQYIPSTSKQLDPLLGVGVGYQWDSHPITVNLGVSFYNLDTTAGGTNQPYINIGPNFDNLSYSANGTSFALLLEPKFILARWNALQPYFLTGIGIAFNHFTGYSEAPNDSSQSASPTLTPFNAKTNINPSYEVGIGIQYALGSRNHAPILALDYRYLDLGNAGVDNAETTTNNGLSFGRLSTGVTTLSVILPF